MTWEENNNNKLFQWKQEGVKMGHRTNATNRKQVLKLYT